MDKKKLIALISYTVSSLSSSAVDVLLYAVIVRLFFKNIDETGITIATVFARIGSSFVNYAINHKLTFKGQSAVGPSMVRFFILAMIQIGVSAAAVIYFYKYLHFNDVLAKMVIDSVILYASFPIQKSWVFRPSSKEGNDHTGSP